MSSAASDILYRQTRQEILGENLFRMRIQCTRSTTIYVIVRQTMVIQLRAWELLGNWSHDFAHRSFAYFLLHFCRRKKIIKRTICCFLQMRSRCWSPFLCTPFSLAISVARQDKTSNFLLTYSIDCIIFAAAARKVKQIRTTNITSLLSVNLNYITYLQYFTSTCNRVPLLMYPVSITESADRWW